MKPKPLTPKVNFLVKSKTEIKPLSKTTKYIFLLFQFVLALDFGFVKLKSARMKIIVKLFCLTQGSALIIYLCDTFWHTHRQGISPWYTLDIFMYYTMGLLMLFSKHSYYDFQLDLHSFDAEIRVDSDSYKLEYAMLFVFLCLISLRMFAAIFTCSVFSTFCDFPIFVVYGYTITIVGLNTVLLVYSFLFQSVYCRMKQFVIFVRNEGADVVSCHYLYKNIVEITERVKKTFDLVLILALIYFTMDVTLTVYLPFANESLQEELHLKGWITYAMVAQELAMMFAPSVTAGLLCSQVDKLRLVLYDLLVKDQKHTVDIRRFISYIDARPLRFKVWMVIPLDWTLPVIVVNISITYLIVMIQFTHK